MMLEKGTMTSAERTCKLTCCSDALAFMKE